MLCCLDDVPALENFAYGDTPTLEALEGLVKEVLGGGDEVAIDAYSLSASLDLRQLVLSTALTYLELDGWIEELTTYHSEYEFKLKLDRGKLIGAFNGEAQRIVSGILSSASFGRTWYKLDPEVAAKRLGIDRRLVSRGLDKMEERGFAEVRASGFRRRYRVLRTLGDLQQGTASPASMLYQRFLDRESNEIKRVGLVVEFVSSPTCQWRRFTAYFGQELEKDCGHCGVCKTGKATELKPLRVAKPMLGAEQADLRNLIAAHPDALGHSRQVARFLCGITSPAATRAKLTKHALFGRLEGASFADILAIVEELCG
jgi:ATP-dependent DNA helicase RecQ